METKIRLVPKSWLNDRVMLCDVVEALHVFYDAGCGYCIKGGPKYATYGRLARMIEKINIRTDWTSITKRDFLRITYDQLFNEKVSRKKNLFSITNIAIFHIALHKLNIPHPERPFHLCQRFAKGELRIRDYDVCVADVVIPSYRKVMGGLPKTDADKAWLLENEFRSIGINGPSMDEMLARMRTSVANAADFEKALFNSERKVISNEKCIPILDIERIFRATLSNIGRPMHYRPISYSGICIMFESVGVKNLHKGFVTIEDIMALIYHQMPYPNGATVSVNRVITITALHAVLHYFNLPHAEHEIKNVMDEVLSSITRTQIGISRKYAKEAELFLQKIKGRNLIVLHPDEHKEDSCPISIQDNIEKNMEAYMMKGKNVVVEEIKEKDIANVLGDEVAEPIKEEAAAKEENFVDDLFDAAAAAVMKELDKKYMKKPETEAETIEAITEMFSNLTTRGKYKCMSDILARFAMTGLDQQEKAAS